MKFKDILLYCFFCFSIVAIAQEQTQEESDHNYIRTRQMLNAEGTQFIESVQYFDGLGRATQQITKNITPSRQHLITLQEYNLCGQVSKQWLPAVSSEAELLPADNKSEAISFYGDNRPYVETFYESSPSARVSEIQGVGRAWDGHSDRNEYLLNNTSDLSCQFYACDNNSNLLDKGVYPSGSLFVTKQLDADNHEVYSFKDGFGNVILTRQKSGSNHDTYYVYDKFGRLCYVLPPMINGNISYSNLEKYAYRYTYDIDGNCCEKKLPGCTPIYMVYDKAKRLILYQDGNQRAKNLWTCTKYDILGRVAYTCEIKEATPVVTLRTTYRNQLIKENYSPNSSGLKGTGYTCNFFANQVERLLEVNYYDDYQYLDNLAPTKKSKLISQQREGYATPYSCAKGLLTGKRVYELSNPRHYSTTSYYYDEKGNNIQEHLCMSLGHENHIYSAYNFSNSLLKMQKEHHVYVGRNREKTSTTERYAMIYDHVNRLIKTEYQFNNNPSIILKQNVYDELGRLQRIYRHNRLDSIGYKYNIRNQVTTIHNNDLREQLYYADSQVGNIACYNGNISAIAWNYKAFENCYRFQYDGLNRYTESHFIQDGHVNQRTYATSLSYDKNGNITRLTRTGANSKELDNLTYNYDGNQVKEISDAFGSKCTQKIKEYHDNHEGENDFYYDANGSMIADLDRNIVAIRYNLLNLPDTIQFKDGNQIVNYYDATGALLERKNRIISSKLCLPLAEVCKRNELLMSQSRKIFMDNCEFELEMENDDEEIVRVPRYNTSEGYVIGTGKQMRYYYQRKDHLGSVKELFYVDKDNHLITIKEIQYYPSGLPMEDSNEKMAWVGSEKYNGKKYLEMHGYDCSDYGARHYYPTIERFTSVDPLAEKYYSVSPYAYCHNNPLNRIDPDGRTDFLVKGKVIGNDGVDDQRVLTVRTEALTKKEVKETKKFIKANSGNTEAFQNNGMAYTNSIAIESSADNRQAMVNEVSKDNGKGGTAEANNREYGGSIQNGTVVTATPGAVANPQTDATASILLPSGVSTFHSHPSGTVVDAPPAGTLGGTTTTYSFNQSPSPQDITNAGNNTNYVFGRSARVVYVYTANGLQALIPMKRFVTPKK